MLCPLKKFKIRGEEAKKTYFANKAFLGTTNKQKF